MSLEEVVSKKLMPSGGLVSCSCLGKLDTGEVGHHFTCNGMLATEFFMMEDRSGEIGMETVGHRRELRTAVQRRRVERWRLGEGVLSLFQKLSVYLMSFQNVRDNFPEEEVIRFLSFPKVFGGFEDSLWVLFDAFVSRGVGSIVANLINLTVGALFDHLVRDVAFDLGDADAVVAFGFGGAEEISPEIGICAGCMVDGAVRRIGNAHGPRGGQLSPR